MMWNQSFSMVIYFEIVHIRRIMQCICLKLKKNWMNLWHQGRHLTWNWCWLLTTNTRTTALLKSKWKQVSCPWIWKSAPDGCTTQKMHTSATIPRFDPVYRPRVKLLFELHNHSGNPQLIFLATFGKKMHWENASKAPRCTRVMRVQTIVPLF